jgi:hypothetical protein
MEYDLRDDYSFGTLGHNHLLSTAQKAFARAETSGAEAMAEIETGIRLLCMAFVEFPLNSPLAGQLLALKAKSPLVGRLLTEAGLRLAAAVAPVSTANDMVAEQLFADKRFDEMEARFDTMAARPGALPVARQALMRQTMLSRWQWAESFVRESLFRSAPDLAAALLPDILLAGQQYEQAVTACEKLVSLFGLPLGGFRLALARAGAGDVEGAKSILSRILKLFPDHVSALLALDRIVFPPAYDARLEGRCAVSIYSYNKADELRRTLDSVLASDLSSGCEDVVVRVLVNGSEDDSLAVAEAARERFGGVMEVVALPVNVGAPAARNWLLDAACRDGAEWIAFLDDDVLVPGDWLCGMAAGTRDFPDAGVWGCRIADDVSPSLTQHADGFLLDRGETMNQDHEVAIHEPGIECLVPDFLGYRRYCASVTGCCHLFRVETLAGNRGFDLGFSPSQFDDLDSDLRLLAGGKPAAYLGDVAVTHLRPANPFMTQSQSSQVLGESHRSLLDGRHAVHLDHMVGIQAEIVASDLDARRDRLRAARLLNPSE